MCDLFVSGVLWCFVWGTYPVNSYMVSEQFEGRIRWWSKFEVGTIASDCRFLDLLFLTALRLRRLLYCVRSICSSEEPLSFHAKRFPVALPTSFLRSGVIQSLFAVLAIHFSVYFGLFSPLFFITGSIHFISAYALCPATLCDLGKSNKKEGFFLCVCSFPPRLSVILEIRNIEENI